MVRNRRLQSPAEASGQPTAWRSAGLVLVVLGVMCAATSIDGQIVRRTIWDGVFTAEQATRGKPLYETSCGYCHRDDLSGGGGDEPGAVPPPLGGEEFLRSWANLDLGGLVAITTQTMPYERPKLQPQAYRDIISYILLANGAPAGSAELPEDPASLSAIAIVPKP